MPNPHNLFPSSRSLELEENFAQNTASVAEVGQFLEQFLEKWQAAAKHNQELRQLGLYGRNATGSIRAQKSPTIWRGLSRLSNLVRDAGFEPATFGSGGRRSIQLS